MKWLIRDRMQEFMARAQERARELVSEPWSPSDANTPIGGPPRRRTGNLQKGIRSRVMATPNGYTGTLMNMARSKTSGVPYGNLLEQGFRLKRFMVIGNPGRRLWKVPKRSLGLDWDDEQDSGPFPYMAPTMQYMRNVAKKTLGRPLSAIEMSHLTSTMSKQTGWGGQRITVRVFK